MNRENMVRRHISIPVNLDDDMRGFLATTKNRWEKGAFSDLVIDAVRSYMDPGTHTQKRISKRHSDHKCDALFSGIKEYLNSERGFTIFNDIHQKLIDQAISELMVIRDRRSIRNWRKKLEDGGYIERLKDEHYNDTNLFKFLKEGIDAKNITIERTEGEMVTK